MSPDLSPAARRWAELHGPGFARQFTLTPAELDEHWKKQVGTSRLRLTARLAEEVMGLTPQSTILEAGCNAGNQMVLFQTLGYSEIMGVDVCGEALAVARRRGCLVHCHSVEALPAYWDGMFDLVFTCGVLSHVEPERRGRAICELVRVTRRWLWLCEYRALPAPYASRPDLAHDFLWPDWWETRVRAADPALVLVEDFRASGPERIQSVLFRKEKA